MPFCLSWAGACSRELALCFSAAFQYFEEGAGTDLFQGESGEGDFVLVNGAGIEGAEEEIEEALASGGIVENVAVQGGFG